MFVLFPLEFLLEFLESFDIEAEFFFLESGEYVKVTEFLEFELSPLEEYKTETFMFTIDKSSPGLI
jgi:hypothetical protein